ncbi:MAG: universal stress protein, partial [Alphaproteobacteria bacterium]
RWPQSGPAGPRGRLCPPTRGAPDRLEDPRGRDRGDRPPLDRHGDLLLSAASDFGADLLVMGAYGHSRIRELVLGGATRYILQHMTIPVPMSH